MKISTELKNKASYNNMKFSVITEQGDFFSCDSLKESKDILKYRSGICVRSRLMNVELIGTEGKSFKSGTAKFANLENLIEMV